MNANVPAKCVWRRAAAKEQEGEGEGDQKRGEKRKEKRGGEAGRWRDDSLLMLSLRSR